MVSSKKKTENQIYLSHLEITDQRDIPQIETILQKGEVVLIQTESFFDKYQDDLVTLKKTIDQLKSICTKFGGNLGRIDEDILVLTPNNSIQLF